jgi:hypothetical protein
VRTVAAGSVLASVLASMVGMVLGSVLVGSVSLGRETVLSVVVTCANRSGGGRASRS